MPDESLGSTAGIAAQAAEVSHSVTDANRTSLADMTSANYMMHMMMQIRMMNIRQLQRLVSGNVTGESDLVSLSSYYHCSIASECQRGSGCSCHSTTDDGSPVQA